MFNSIIKKIRLRSFNSKWANKKVHSCELLFNEMFITRNVSFICCDCSNSPYSPPYFKIGAPEFSLKEYLKGIDEELTKNLQSEGNCISCTFAKDFNIPKLSDRNIKTFVINHFTKCNCNCVYCAINPKAKLIDTNVKLMPYIKKLEKEKFFSKDCRFIWGGGEPTLLEEFEPLFNYLKSKNYYQHINTSGKIFSPAIFEGLKSGYLVVVSPDSGTEKTYRKIKRSGGFEKLWENIKEYSKANGDFLVKYILFSYNSDKEEIFQFIERCKENNVVRVQLDCEFNSASGKYPYPIAITEKEISAAKYFIKLCKENNLEYSLGVKWPEKYKKAIEET